MNLKSKYFDTIRMKKSPIKEVKSSQTCDWPECSKMAGYPAPIAGDAKVKRHFCFRHVQQYNKTFNFFENMDAEDVVAYQRSSSTGHRPTWTIGTKGRDKKGRLKWEDSIELMDTSRSSHKVTDQHYKIASIGQIRALDILNLDERADSNMIKHRYKERIKQYHPDTNGGDRQYEQLLTKIIQAYNYLRASGFLT